MSRVGSYTAARMSSVGEGFAWPFQDPDWFGKVIVQGLIGVIPIVGWIALAGWMMITIDNYRAGRRELAPAGFHLGRGGPIFVVALVYSIVLAVPGSTLTGVGNSAHATGLVALGDLMNFALRLLLSFLAPALIVQTYQRGLAGGFDVRGVWEMTTGNMNNSLVAGLVIVAANFIGGAGVILCCVGLIFSVPYALAITAGTAVWYEQVLGGPRSAPPT
jgi:hypothetical protein